MCCSTYYPPPQSHSQTHHLSTITAFFVRFPTPSSSEFNTSKSLSSFTPSKPGPFPQCLTLCFPLYNDIQPLERSDGYLNRAQKIDTGEVGLPIDTNNRKVKIQFLSLRRLKQASTEAASGVIFGSKQRVQVTTEALDFSLYVGEMKLLKGVIRRTNNNWEMECGVCDFPSCLSISEMELFVVLTRDGHLSAIRERVAMPVVKTRNKKSKNKVLKLEEIPEETEGWSENDGDCDGVDDADENNAIKEHLEMDLESLRLAMDMGIWVLCLGFGYMVSRASKAKPRCFFDLHYFFS